MTMQLLTPAGPSIEGTGQAYVNHPPIRPAFDRAQTLDEERTDFGIDSDRRAEFERRFDVSERFLRGGNE